MFGKSVEPFHHAGDVYKAQKRDVELVKASGDTAKDLHALEEVFNQVPRLVAVSVQDALVFLRLTRQGMMTSMLCFSAAWTTLSES